MGKSKDTLTLSLLDLLAEPAAAAETSAPVAAETKPLIELCRNCKSAHPDCSRCCSVCRDQCNLAQDCFWPNPKTAPVAPPKSVLIVPEAEKESALRDSTCKEWRKCHFCEACFTPENNAAGICYKDEPHLIPANVAGQYSRDEFKILAAGFSLVKYFREQKTLRLSAADPSHGWVELDPFTTFAAAERKLKELKEKGNIESDINGKIDRHNSLSAAGFEFYRFEGVIPGHGIAPRIKQGSKNWGTWAKYETPEELKMAWSELMQNPKALEG